MKHLLAIVITLGVAVGFVLLALEDPGYVMLTRAPYTVRLPLALFVLLGLLSVATLYLLVGCIGAIRGVPKKVREWHKQRTQNRAQIHTMQGYVGLIEGNWSQAEQALLRKLQHNHTPLLNYLGAAYAAQQQGNLPRRNQYLTAALAQHPQQQLAINLTAARLQYQAGELDEARKVLEQLRRSAPHSVAPARLLAEVYRQLGDWSSLLTLLPVLVRLQAFPPTELAAQEARAYERYLTSPTLFQDDTHPSEAFNTLPADRKNTPAAIAAYSKQLLKVGEHALAEKTLSAALKKNWDAELAYLYGKAEVGTTHQQIQLAESWAKKYGSHADLTLTLARLYRRAGKLEKAMELFRQVIEMGGRKEAHADLATLLEEIGDPEGALLCYRQGQAARDTKAKGSTYATLANPDAQDSKADASTEPQAMPMIW